MIGLSYCEFITKLPDLCCPNLLELNLQDCKNLIEVHDSIGLLEKLNLWNFNGCSQLQIVPSMLMSKSLEYFNLEGCSRLKKFPDIHPELPDLCGPNLMELNLQDCKNLIEVHDSIGLLEKLPDLCCPNLMELNLQDCKNLIEVHDSIGLLEKLNSSLLYLTGLEQLYLWNKKLTNFLVGANNFSGPTGFQSLVNLNLSRSPRIKGGLDSWMQPDYFPVLTDLSLSHTGIVTIPESISRFPRLLRLEIQNCKKLREIPRLPQSIRTVNAQNCDRLDTKSSSRLLNQVSLSLSLSL